MRLPFPTRISLQKVLIFAAAVFMVQQMEHTDVIFSVLFFAFVMLSAIAFNFARGFSRASGAYVFWFASLTCIVGVVWKIILGEPANSNLVSADATMSTYVVSMLAIIGSLFVSRKIVRNPRGLPSILKADGINLGLASLGCLLVNEVTVAANMFLPGGNGSLVAIINQINIFLPLSILLGTVYVIQSSGGRRSVNVVTLVAALLIFVFGGLLTYSKQGMFTPIVCWGVAAASQRYRLRAWQVGLLLAFSIYSVTILSPLSQVGRANIPDDADSWQRAQLTTYLLTHPTQLRADYKNEVAPEGVFEAASTGFAPSYFNSPQGLFDRLSIIQSDDRLITFTLRGNKEGYQRLGFYFINWIPHFIFPGKDRFAPPGATNPGNWYAHEMGTLVSENDFTTGISFSPTAEAFHLELWLGLLTLAPAVWTLLFTVMDLICGNLRKSPFGLIIVVAFAHVAPESLLSGLVQFIWNGSIGLIVAIFFCAYFAPILGALFAGPENSRIAHADAVAFTALGS
jgi:hypothetical protein